MKGATFDKSRNLPLYARIGEAGVPRILTFLNSDRSPRDISGKEWQLPVKKRAGYVANQFLLTEGNGLTVEGDDNNKLRIEITAEQSEQRNDTLFYTLYSAAEDHSWLNGFFRFHNGEFDGLEDPTEEIIIYENGEEIVIVLEGGEGSGTSIQFQNEGTNLGNNQADTVDFVGNGVNATRTDDKITVTITQPESLFLGIFTTLNALETAHPTAEPGSYADVDPGAGTDAIRYHWDEEDGWIEGGAGGALQSLSSGNGVQVDNTDPVNPVVNLGALTGDKIITGGYTLKFGEFPNRLAGFGAEVTGGMTFRAVTIITLDGGQQLVLTSSTSQTFTSGSFVFQSGKASFGGGANYASIRIGNLNADPSVLDDGDIWYRADLDEFRGRANGATITFGVKLIDGSGTTVNGNAVDLGGTITAATTITQGNNEITFTGTKTTGDQVSISRTHATGSGISAFNGTLSIEGTVAGGGGFYSALIFKQQWTPDAGARQYNVITATGNINVAGGINVTSAPSMINLRPDINITSGTLATLTGILFSPTYTSGAPIVEYALMLNTGLSKFGNISTVPTARIHIHAGSATIAPLKLESGTALTTPQDGAIEYDNSHLYFTIGSTRYQLDQQGSSVVWGAITGTLSDQTDLQAALGAKEDLSNKVGTVAASATQYPNNNAVINYSVPQTRTINGLDLSANISLPHSVLYQPKSGSSRYIVPQILVGGLGQANLTANQLRAYPLIISETTIITGLSFVVTGGIAATEFRVGIFTNVVTGGQNYPNALIPNSDIQVFSSVSNGNVSGSFSGSITLQAGLYWIVYNSNGAAQMRTINPANMPMINGVSGGNIGGNSTEMSVGWQSSTAYSAAGITTPFPAGATFQGGTATQFMMVRLAV